MTHHQPRGKRILFLKFASLDDEAGKGHVFTPQMLFMSSSTSFSALLASRVMYAPVTTVNPNPAAICARCESAPAAPSPTSAMVLQTAPALTYANVPGSIPSQLPATYGHSLTEVRP